MLTFNKKSRKGFTLVELLVVIAIIGILAALAVPRFTDASASAKGAKILADLRTIDSAVSLYQAQYGAYPGSVGALTTANLLASTPAPQTGTAIINGNKHTVNSTAYNISTATNTTGRAVLGTVSSTNTADTLATLTGTGDL